MCIYRAEIVISPAIFIEFIDCSILNKIEHSSFYFMFKEKRTLHAQRSRCCHTMFFNMCRKKPEYLEETTNIEWVTTTLSELKTQTPVVTRGLPLHYPDPDSSVLNLVSRASAYNVSVISRRPEVHPIISQW